jgi:hypothetical protein
MQEGGNKTIVAEHLEKSANYWDNRVTTTEPLIKKNQLTMQEKEDMDCGSTKKNHTQ